MKFVIVDNNLISYRGHSFEYARSIYSYIKSLGYNVTIVANSCILQELRKEMEIVPHFRYGIDWRFSFPIPVLNKLKPVRLFWDYWHHTRSFYCDLSTLWEKIPVDQETVILFHTIRHFQLLSIVKWVENIPFKKMPYFAIVLRFTTFSANRRPKYTAVFYRDALRRLEKNRIHEKVLLFTDSELVADEYHLLTRLPIRILPIPHTKAGEITADRRKGSPVCLTYLGDARLNKGFGLLPYVFEKLSPEIERGEIEIEVQANITDQSQWRVKLALEQLHKLKIKFYQNSLSNQEYYGLLNRAGIVLLPYTLDDYHSQTSGIFAEALSFGKPVIVSQGTWMAHQLRTYGSGLTFLPGDAHSLYETIKEGLKNYEILSSLAVDRARRWNERHSPDTFLKTIIDSITEQR
jgi:glycosyltransferase involved in cell wall biosynthesis